MRTALTQLLAYYERPKRFPNLGSYFTTALLTGLLSFTAASAVSSWREHTIGTPVPFALTILPLGYLGLLLLTLSPSREHPWIGKIRECLTRSVRYDPALKIETRTIQPDGTIELMLRPQRPLRLKFFMALFLAVAMIALSFLIVGLLAAAEQSESLARDTLTQGIQELEASGLFALLLAFIPLGYRVAWKDTRLCVHGNDVDRGAISRVAIVPVGDLPTLQLRCTGRRRSIVLREEVFWTAGILETLGYEIEFSEKPI